MQTEIMMAAIPPPLIPPCFLVVTGVVSPLACVGVDFVVVVLVVVLVVPLATWCVDAGIKE